MFRSKNTEKCSIQEDERQAAEPCDPDQLTRDEAEIESSRMNQQAFQDVRVAAQMGAAHAAVS